MKICDCHNDFITELKNEPDKKYIRTLREEYSFGILAIIIKIM